MRETTRSRFCAFLAIAALAAAFARASYVSVPDGLEDRSPGNHGNAGGDPVTFSCELDPKLTEADFPFFVPDIQGNWGQACGRNRGVFVLDPPDGHTYGCGNLPEEWGVASVADLTNLTKTQPETALNAYANLVAAIYNTTIGKTAEACDFDALTILTCGREEPWKTAPWYHQLLAPIQAVNIGGLFVLERWIVPNFTQWGNESGIRDQSSFCEKCEGLGTCDDLKDHWKNWYKPDDFKDMKESGLNSVRLPVGWWYFAEKSAISRGPYIVPDEDLYDRHHPITDVIRWAKDAGLYVILDLHGAPGSQNGLDNSGVTSPDPNELVWGETWMYDPENYGKTVRTLAAMAEYINHIEDSFDLDNVMALELLNEPWAHLDLGRVRDFYVTSIEAVRLVRPTMPIIVHDSFRGPMWATLLKNFPFENIVMDTHIYHGFNPADLSSDTAESDRQKMYVHERMACSYTSMLRYQTCACLPVFVGEWSLAIDNCMPWLDSKFADFGQCNNLAEREKADWWTDHTRSFAMRQIAMYEREMGWSFWTWKLEDDLEKNEQASKYWSFRLAVEHGFIDTKFPSDSCKHPPVVDWMKPLPTSTTNNNSDNNDSRHGLADDQQPTDLPATTTTTGPEEARGGPDEAGAIGGGEGGGLAEQQAEGASPELGTADTPGSAARSSPSFMTMTMLVMVGAMVGMAAAVAMDRLKHGGNGGSGGGGGRGGGHGELGSRGAVGAGNWMSAVFSPGYETIGSDSTP